MQNILVISDVNSHLLFSIGADLKDVSYHVIRVGLDTDTVYSIKEPICCIMLFCGGDLAVEQQLLHFLKDKAIADNIPFVIIGNDMEIEIIKEVIPPELIRFEFCRPIHVHNLVATVDRFLKNNSIQRKKKILVVDDSGPMLRSVKGWLEEQYDVFLANSGAMMLKYLTLNRPDLVLLDYEMPVCDGKQALEMIRTEKDFSDIPVVFLTNKNDEQSIKKVMALKPQGYLLKSLEPSQIIQEVDAFFNKQKALL